jgi:ABC-type dipeptide/oligopeptide/nickel transport system permease component
LSYRRFFLIRLVQALFAMWLVATLVFVMFFVLLAKPARNLAGGKQATPSMIARVSEELHLDAPLGDLRDTGLGRLMLISYNGQALVLMQSVVLYAAFLGIAVSFLVDAIVAALDSEVRDEWRFVARPRRAT